MSPLIFGPPTPLEMIQGIFNTIFVVITIYIGLIFISKYFQHKNRNLYLFGIFWIGAAIWFVFIPIQFVLLFFEITIHDWAYYLVMYPILPVIAVVWLIAVTKLLYFDRRTLFLRVFTLMAILFEILFFSFLFIDDRLIATRPGYFYIEMTPFAIFYIVFLMSFILITGVMFGISSLDSKNPEIRMKGKLIIISIFLFGGGAATDLLIPPLDLDPIIKAIITIIARILMSSSGILFYIGFMLPNWTKKILFRKK